MIAYTLRPDPVNLVQSLGGATHLKPDKTSRIFLGERHLFVLCGVHVLWGLLCMQCLLELTSWWHSELSRVISRTLQHNPLLAVYMQDSSIQKQTSTAAEHIKTNHHGRLHVGARRKHRKI